VRHANRAGAEGGVDDRLTLGHAGDDEGCVADRAPLAPQLGPELAVATRAVTVRVRVPECPAIGALESSR
jgi:hypothetical protein